VVKKRRTARRPSRARGPWWVDLDTEALLDVRLCDLDLALEGSVLGERVDSLVDELDRKGLRYRPYVWLSDDWFTPEGSSGFAVPFYLAQPRLVRLEHSEMFEAEGSTRVQCVRLLRHETAHAVGNERLDVFPVWRCGSRTCPTAARRSPPRASSGTSSTPSASASAPARRAT